MVQPRQGQRGMVTAELAVGLVTASMALVIACWVVNLVVVQTTCGDVAAQMARQLARDDDKAAAQARQRAPEGARVTIEKGSSTVTVTVAVQQRLGELGPVQVQGRAVADMEEGERGA